MKIEGNFLKFQNLTSPNTSLSSDLSPFSIYKQKTANLTNHRTIPGQTEIFQPKVEISQSYQDACRLTYMHVETVNLLG